MSDSERAIGFREQRHMKSKVHRTKPGRVDCNNDLDVILVRSCQNCLAASHYDIPYGTLLNCYNKRTKPSKQAHDPKECLI